MRVNLETFFPGPGTVAQRLRGLDWSATDLGPPERWPQSLKTIVRVMLGSRYAMWLAWGPKLTFLCNDAYLPTVGLRRDWVLGQPSTRVWSEIWQEIGPRIEHVLATGEATWDEALLLFLERSGYPEETYHTFSYSPVADDDDVTRGMLCVVTEETERVIGQRRLALLRDLAARLTSADTEEAVHRAHMRSIETDARDLPVTLTYVFDGRERLRLAARTGLPEGDPAAPPTLGLDDAPWPLRTALESGQAVAVDDLGDRFAGAASRVWGRAPQRALVVPIAQPGQSTPAGVFIAGLNPFRPLDDSTIDFVKLVAGQLESGLGTARGYEAERQRAAALAEIDRAKTVFFSNVSHEFRTPLTLMMGPLHDLLQAQGDELPEAARETVRVALRNSQRLLRLVNSLLDFSRIEAGRIESSYEKVDLAAVTADLASVFRAACERAGLELSVECEPVAGHAYVDRDMWEKIVLNLLSNAFKYTFEGGIAVRLRSDAKRAYLSVKDTGIGIPASALPRVFERFYRVPDARGRAHEGTGIGLALVQELVRLHGGTIEVASEPGQGTTFTVALPLGSAHLPADRVRGEAGTSERPFVASAFVDEAMRWLPPAASAPTSDPLELSPADPVDRGGTAAGDPPARVLVADDNADMRDYLRKLLARRFDVVTAADGREALDRVAEALPDVVVADVMMPRLDGFGLLRELRGDERTRELPVVLLSARAGEEARVIGLDAGADDYLVKPFSARELVARVGAHVAMARLRRHNREALRESEQRFRVMADSSPNLIWAISPQRRIDFVNRAYRDFFGIDEQQSARSGWQSLLHPDDASACLGEIDAALDERRAFVVRARVRRADGAWRWVQSHGTPRFAADGAYLGAVGSTTDVTELVQAHEVLKEADRRKDEFVATLAHELRNPLAPIRQAAQIAKAPQATSAQIRWSHDVIERQVQHMALLLDDLLDVSRITRGTLTLRKEPVDLASAVDAAVETARPLIDARRQRLSIELPAEPVRVQADPVRLAQVFSNLLTNAAKYTDSEGRIAIRVVRDGDAVQVRVSDTGIGLSPEAIPGLFSMFSQVKSAIDRAEGGLGIGLALARGLVELHDGTIAAESAGFGKGSTFIVRLPALPADDPQRADAPASDAGSAGLRRCKVLVVDDNRDAADSLAMLIGLDGHEVRMAHDGLEALEVGAQFQPDFMLLDIGMPKLNGYAVAQRLRGERWGERVTLVALTGWGSREDRERAFSAGFDHHLTKPVDPDLVRALMSGDASVRASSSAGVASREPTPAAIARPSAGRPGHRA